MAESQKDQEAKKAKRELVEENIRLKDRIHNLEETINELENQLEGDGEEGPGGKMSGMIKVLKRKDETLDKYARKLEKNNRKLQETIDELEKKNRELRTSTATLRLYEQIFEQDPNALLGVDENLSIIHFNQAAVEFFGEELHALRAAPVDQLPTEKLEDMDLKENLTTAMEEGESKKVTFTPPDSDSTHFLIVTPIRNEESEIRAGLLRIRPETHVDEE